MRPASLLLALAQVAFIGLTDAAKCNADNCARAATGTAGGLLSSRAAACTSFQQCTVVGAATTVTTVSTVTVPAMAAKFRLVRMPKRQAATPVTSCPSAIPTFASTCGVSSRYESACSCFGVTKTYTTISGSTVTVTDVSTVTATAPPVTSSSSTSIVGTGPTAPTGTAPTGTAPTGTAPTGTAPTSSSSSSSAPTAPTGTAPSGTGASPTAPSGTGASGTAPSGGIPSSGANSTFAFPNVPATVINFVRL